MSRLDSNTFTALLVVALVLVSGCSAGTSVPDTETLTEAETATPTGQTTVTKTATDSSTPTRTPTPSSEALADKYGPWLGESAEVAVAEDASEGLRGDVKQAIEWWEAHGDDHLPYEINLRLINETDEADIIVSHVDRISTCGYDDTDEIRGCADLLDPDEPAPARASVQIERGLHPEVQPHVVRHEFGHILGLPHQPSPGIMQSPAEFDVTNLQDRANPWAQDTLYVHVDLSDYGGPSDRFNEQVNQALNWYEQGAAGNMDYDIRFEQTSNKSKADIVITGAKFDNLDTVASYDVFVWNVDSDPEAEWYYQQRINITEDAQTSAVGWYVAWSLWEAVGSGERPYELRTERDFHYRRSSWWR